MTKCPKSETTGKRVERITLESLLRCEFHSDIGSAQWFYCPDPACEVAYFDAAGNTLDKSALSVRIGVKEDGSPRPICYCFDHSIEEIEDEVAATGTSKVPDSIAEKCGQGLHECELKNPQGSCCLGNVRVVMKKAQSSGSCSTASSEQDCCEAPAEVPPVISSRRTAGRLASVGAVISAVLSSACCWLPLLLLAFGASAAGVSGFFERYRPVFLGASTVLLAAGFYFVYVRKPACEPDAACSVPNARLTRINRGMLWVAAVFVATFALFPNYVGVLLGTDQLGETTSTAAPHDMEFAVNGMTCEACAVTLRSKLAALPGVSTAEVLYSSGRARLRFESNEARPTADAIVEAVADSGYEAILP